MQTDPVGTKDDLNLYVYALNDAANRIDPTGLESPCVTIDGCRTFGTGDTSEGIGFVADLTPVVGDIKAAKEAIENPSVVNVTAAIVGVVPGVGDVAAKGIKTVGNIVENAAKGKAGEAITRAKLGDDIAAEQVTFRTSDGTTTRTDFGVAPLSWTGSFLNSHCLSCQ